MGGRWAGKGDPGRARVRYHLHPRAVGTLGEALGNPMERKPRALPTPGSSPSGTAARWQAGVSWAGEGWRPGSWRPRVLGAECKDPQATDSREGLEGGARNVVSLGG